MAEKPGKPRADRAQPESKPPEPDAQEPRRRNGGEVSDPGASGTGRGDLSPDRTGDVGSDEDQNRG